jgi:hypothetical protein
MVTPRADKKCEDWKTRYRGVLFFANSISLVQQTFGQGCSARFGDFKIGGQVIRNVQNTDDHVLLANEATAIPDVINRLIKHSKMLGMARNVKETMVMRISRQPSRVRTMTNKNNLIYIPQHTLSMNSKY